MTNADSQPVRKATFNRFVKIAARVGVGLFVLVLFFSCARVPGLKEEVTENFIRVPFVRVLLDDTKPEVTVSANNPYAVECITNGQQLVYYLSGTVRVQNNGGMLTVLNKSRQAIQEGMDEVNIIPRRSSTHLEIDDTRYRGLLNFRVSGQGLEAVNIVYMEDYLRGVVPPEIGQRTDDEIEAVKAQAVAARTYAMAHLKQYGDQPYDIKASIIDQVYGGMNVEDGLVNKAIDATAGMNLMYNDQFVDAYYHSTCGGMTDNIEHVWDRKEVPYLKAVSDDGACSWSKYYRWKEVFTEKQLRGRIEQYLASDRGRDLRIGKIKDLTITSRTPGGRVAELVVVTDQNRFSFHKDRIRWVLGRTSNPDLILPSDRFDMAIERNSDSTVRVVTFSGSGYGHGVGMCQCGAIGYARRGWTYNQILTHYYTGTEVRKLY
jgi:stage II sporulation protein D